MLTGAPGAAIIYSILGLVLWPRENPLSTRPNLYLLSRWSENGTIARIIWAIVWCGTSLLELESPNFAPNAVSTELHTAGLNQPGWLHWLDLEASKLTSGIGPDVAFVLLLAEFLTGWLILRKSTRNIAIVLGIVISIIFWLSGQGVGYLLTGEATDPNLGPAIVLFALAVIANIRSYSVVAPNTYTANTLT